MVRFNFKSKNTEEGYQARSAVSIPLWFDSILNKREIKNKQLILQKYVSIPQWFDSILNVEARMYPDQGPYICLNPTMVRFNSKYRKTRIYC